MLATIQTLPMLYASFTDNFNFLSVAEGDYMCICVVYLHAQPSQHHTLTQCWFNVGPSSATLNEARPHSMYAVFLCKASLTGTEISFLTIPLK